MANRSEYPVGKVRGSISALPLLDSIALNAGTVVEEVIAAIGTCAHNR
jgi:hypothetical protein